MEDTTNLQLNRDEMKRRADLSRAGVPTTTNFEKVAGLDDDAPFVNEEQSWVLFSTSHSEMAPLAKDKRFPGLRVYGCFDSAESATDYAKHILSPSDPSCSIQLNRTHEWICACKNAANLANLAYVNTKTSALIASHAVHMKEAKADFNANIVKMQQNTESVELKETTDEERPAVKGDEMHDTMKPNVKQKTKPLPKMCELSGQTFMCVSIIQDTQTPNEPEFLFRIYGCFSTIEDADRYVRNVAGQRVTEYDINVVNLLKWIFPTQEVDVLTKYRASELTSIMQHHREQPAKVQEYHTTMNERREAPIDEELENAPLFSEVTESLDKETNVA